MEPIACPACEHEDMESLSINTGLEIFGESTDILQCRVCGTLISTKYGKPKSQWKKIVNGSWVK